MNTKPCFFLYFALSLSFPGIVPGLEGAQFYQNSAHSAAMGHTLLSSSEEAASLFVNPAALAGIASSEISFLGGQPYAGLPGITMAFGEMALVVPSPFGRFGAGYSISDILGLIRYQAIAVSYSYDLWGSIRTGVSAKQLSRSYLIASDPSVAAAPIFRNGTSKIGIAIDAGVMLPVGSFLTLGAAVRNINQPDLGLLSEDRVMQETQAGFLLDLQTWGLKVTGDILAYANPPGQIPTLARTNWGMEKSLMNDRLALRLGANPLQVAGGFAVRQGAFVIDYAVVITLNLMQDNFGSHQIGISYRLGDADE